MEQAFGKNIRIIIGGLGRGGAERHLSQILPSLAQKGYAIRVITLSRDLTLAPPLLEGGCEVNPLPYDFKFLPTLLRRPLRLIFALLHLYREYRRFPGYINHFFLPEAYALGMLVHFLPFIPQSPLIMSRRSLNNYKMNRPFFRWLEAKLLPRTDLVLGNSQAVINQLQNEENVPAEKLKLIYNGIDLTSFQKPTCANQIRKELGIKEQDLVFTMVANLIPYKGHKDLLEALALIKEELPPAWVFLCVGRDDGILQNLKQQSRQLALEKHIKWLGPRTDIPALLRASNIGVLCSHQEGFSNAVLEGMAAGLPMVVTDVGGNKEAVQNNRTGLVVPPHNPRALSQALLRLAHDQTAAKAMGQAAQNRVNSLFSLDNCVQEYDKIYQDLTGKS